MPNQQVVESISWVSSSLAAWGLLLLVLLQAIFPGLVPCCKPFLIPGTAALEEIVCFQRYVKTFWVGFGSFHGLMVVTSSTSDPGSKREAHHMNMAAGWDPRTWACQCSPRRESLKLERVLNYPAKAGQDIHVGSDPSNSEGITVKRVLFVS